MLSMAAIQSVDYYADLAREDYYHSGGEPPGLWGGQGARLLGLHGVVQPDAYRQVLRGFAPDGRQALCERAGDGHRPGWDLTFNAPKSVSLVWARAEPALRQQLQAAQQAAVTEAVRFLERQAAFTRRGHNGQEQEAVAGLVVATFEHGTSRAQDPHLHTHALVANLAPREDGSWGTLESRHLYRWQLAAGAVYRAELAGRLRTLGFGIEADGHQFRVAGIPEPLCRHFSQRANAIRTALRAAGLASSASAAGSRFKLITRDHKQAVSRPALFVRWQEALDARGLTSAALTQLREADRAPTGYLDPVQILDDLTATQPTFRAQDVYQQAAIHAQTSGDTRQAIEQVARQILADPDTLALGLDDRQNPLYTTRAVLALERQLLHDAHRLRAQPGGGLTAAQVQAAIAQQAQRTGWTLTEEQQEAIHAVCQPGHLATVQGSAGTGKSASMQAVHLAYTATGQRVLGACVAKRAADNLTQETGIPAVTLARLRTDLAAGRNPLAAVDVLVIDEAGQVGTRDLAPLLAAALEHRVKLVLVGEDKQLDAIEHGGVLRYLSRPDQLGTTRIETIRRQRQAWARQAVADLRDGRAEAALQAHADRGLVHFGADREATLATLVQHWHQYQQDHPERQSLVLAQRWAEVKALGAQIRQIHQAEGRVGRNEQVFDCVLGDKPHRLPFARGERVRFGQNDYRLGLANGTLGTLQRVEPVGEDHRFSVTLDDGRTVQFLASAYRDDLGRLPLAHAYAMTVYSSQGVTVEGDVFVYYSSKMDRAHSYVAGSRHKDACHWFANQAELDEHSRQAPPAADPATQRLATLAGLMNRERRKALALAYLEAEPAHQPAPQVVAEPEMSG